MIEILNCQAPVSIQDTGREGLRNLGIGRAGAMDTLALRAGNILLGNAEHAAALEIALGGLTLRFHCDTYFCITGAFYEAELDGQAIFSYWRYPVRAGQTLKLIRAVQGMYAYLCVHGGLDVPVVLNSRSTDIKAQFGGHQGRFIQKNDQLPLGKQEALFPSLPIGIAPIELTNRIHALASSEAPAFTHKAQSVFWHNAWTLQSDSNRMGYRFSGHQLTLTQPLEMLSHAVQAGTVQVPPSGQPIILMADAQTTGGYPKIATIAQADLGRLAQIRFGTQVYFQSIDFEQAAKLRKRDEAYLYQVRKIAQQA